MDTGNSPLVGPPKGRPGDPPFQSLHQVDTVLEREQTNHAGERRCRARKRGGRSLAARDSRKANRKEARRGHRIG
eukprot:13373929-Alexandrium_andersonii.AAC.1